MASTQGHHPLPPPPPPHQARFAQQQQQQQQQQQAPLQQQQQQQQYYPPKPQQHPQYRSEKPQAKPRSFSFRSDKSHKSHGSNHKIDLHETSAEKEAKRLHSKADPTLAMNEAEPSFVQTSVKSSLAPLRNIQHRDPFGNPIAEPDRSNPTRSRWERPLDTIRSFEAAIDGGYSRKSMIRADTDSAANWNRRSSYYGNNGPRFPHDSYYGGRPASTFRPESSYDMRPQGRDGYFDHNNNNGNAYGMGPGPSRHRASRMQSQPEFASYGRGEQAVYPLPHKDRSYETVTSAAGSGASADPAGYQTDPTSSDNSSIDRRSPAKAPQPINDYGIGFNQTTTYQPQAFTVGGGQGYQSGQNNGYAAKQSASQNFAPPPVPMKEPMLNRRPLPQQQPMQRPEPEKRKSWFSRRFSRAS